MTLAMFYALTNDTPKSSLIRARKPLHRPLGKGLQKCLYHNKRKFIHHPGELPISCRRAECTRASAKPFVENSFVGLSFNGREAVEPGTILDVTVNLCDEDQTFQGKVVWIRHLDHYYNLGLCFADEEDAFRVRMIEQVCHIEVYRRRLCKNEGHNIDIALAAQEWIEKFSAQFPKLLQGS